MALRCVNSEAFRSSWLSVLLILAVATGCWQQQENKLTIAAAANLQFVADELIAGFNRSNDIEIELIFGSSGKLTAQITEGAPFDMFLSANLKYPRELHNQGFTTDEPQVYALGTLVLWTTNESLQPTLEMLGSGHIEHIAIANPELAPYGLAAKEVLNSLNLYDQVTQKLVFAESIAQTNQFIVSAAADVGFTARSVVVASDLPGNWIPIDSKLHSPIEQGLVMMQNTPERLEMARKFRDYLFSSEGKEILNNFGYLTK